DRSGGRKRLSDRPFSSRLRRHLGRSGHGGFRRSSLALGGGRPLLDTRELRQDDLDDPGGDVVRGVGEFPFSQNEVVGAVLGREDAWLDLLQKRFWQVREDRKLFQLLDREKVLRRLEGMGKRAGNRAGVGGFTWVQPLTPLRASRSDVRPRKAKSQCFDSLRVRTKTRTLSAC